MPPKRAPPESTAPETAKRGKGLAASSTPDACTTDDVLWVFNPPTNRAFRIDTWESHPETEAVEKAYQEWVAAGSGRKKKQLKLPQVDSYGRPLGTVVDFGKMTWLSRRFPHPGHAELRRSTIAGEAAREAEQQRKQEEEQRKDEEVQRKKEEEQRKEEERKRLVPLDLELIKEPGLPSHHMFDQYEQAFDKWRQESDVDEHSVIPDLSVIIPSEDLNRCGAGDIVQFTEYRACNSFIVTVEGNKVVGTPTLSEYGYVIPRKFRDMFGDDFYDHVDDYVVEDVEEEECLVKSAVQGQQ